LGDYISGLKYQVFKIWLKNSNIQKEKAQVIKLSTT